jgi:hypothetical protein
MWYALRRREVQLEGVASYEEALDRIADAATRLPDGAWLQGGGWDHSLWDGHWPTAADLDTRVPNNPVLLVRKDGHSAWVNTLALAAGGIDETTPDPAGGAIRRERGQPTGVLFESAIDIVRQHIPPASEEYRLSAIRDAITEAHSYGMVGMHIPPGLQEGDGALALADMQRLRSIGKLDLRCLMHLDYHTLDQSIALGIRSGLGDRWIKIGGVKLFADGSLGSETAEMLTHYEGKRNAGIATITTEDLNEAVRKANSNGLSVIIHAIGDAANRRVLDAIQNAREWNMQHKDVSDTNVPFAIPNRIEHAQLLHPHDLPRFAQLGVVASMQPIHATADMEVADRLWGSRCDLAYAWRSLQQSGAVLAFGSDAPVEAMNPWLSIHAAVTRQRINGFPPGGWYPEQRISLNDALRGFTVGAACAAGADREQGTLMPGMLADLAVLSTDPFKAHPGDLHAITSEMTMLEGRIVWERKAP